MGGDFRTVGRRQGGGLEEGGWDGIDGWMDGGGCGLDRMDG